MKNGTFMPKSDTSQAEVLDRQRRFGWANASNTPFRLLKHWVREAGIATPLIVSWPKVAKRSAKDIAPSEPLIVELL